MLRDPNFLWLVIVVLSLSLAAAASRLIVLRRREPIRKVVGQELTELLGQMAVAINKCYRLARESGKLAEFGPALRVLHEVHGSLAPGNVDDLLKLAQGAKALLDEWNAALEQSKSPTAAGTFPLDSGTPLAVVARASGAYSGSTSRSRRMPRLFVQPGPLQGTCTATVILPHQAASFLTFLIVNRSCSLTYRGTESLRIGSTELINEPEVHHRLHEGSNHIEIGGRPIMASWRRRRSELQLAWPRRSSGGSTTNP